MPREIKFRAWDRVNQIMVKVWAIHWKAWDFDNGINFYEVEGIDGTYELMEHKLHLMQYTGLKDKNDVEIYEGDILDVGEEERYHLEEGLPFLLLVNEDGEEYNNGDFYLGECTHEHEWGSFEIVGNIYENPGLLKK